jgi:hypothetical protein
MKLIAKLTVDTIRICGFFNLYQFLIIFFALKREIEKRISPFKFYEIEEPGESFEKYLDTKYWVYINLLRVFELKLHKVKNLKIFDLGTGIGYFPFICNYFGHTVESIDLDTNNLYNSTIKALGVTRYSEKIKSFEHIESGTRYNLITAFMVCFNGHKSKNLWGSEEWLFFLGSLKKNKLKMGGYIYLSLNEEFESSKLKVQEVMTEFIARGAIVDKNKIIIPYSFDFS